MSAGKLNIVQIPKAIFSLLGKFQVLNIVVRFNTYFKSDPHCQLSGKSLLDQFYDYLVNHSLVSEETI